MKCGMEYRVSKCGGYAVEMFSEPPIPYRITLGDVLECPGCGEKVMGRFAEKGTYYHEPGFEALLAATRKPEAVTVTVWETTDDALNAKLLNVRKVMRVISKGIANETNVQ